MSKSVERTRDRIAFVPATDIYEEGNKLLLLVDMPGTDDKSIDIQIEKGILKINGCVEEPKMENYSSLYEEYQFGDYERTFSLSDEIDTAHIEASVKDGVLKLILPIAEQEPARKIKVVGK